MVGRRSVLAALVGAGGMWVAVAPSSPVEISIDTGEERVRTPDRTETVSSAEPPSTTTETSSDDESQASTWDAAAAAKAAHEATNEARVNVGGFSALSWSDEIAIVAEEYAEQMARENFFSHTAPDGTTPRERFAEAGVCYRGENINQTWWQRPVESVGTLSTPDELGQAVVDSWMNSEGHRENILRSRFSREGIGFAKNDRGKVYAVQDFC